MRIAFLAAAAVVGPLAGRQRPRRTSWASAPSNSSSHVCRPRACSRATPATIRRRACRRPWGAGRRPDPGESETANAPERVVATSKSMPQDVPGFAAASPRPTAEVRW